MGFKEKRDAALSKAGVLKPKLNLDASSGKCITCDGMDSFLSLYTAIEVAAAAGYPSCNILMQGVKKYIPNKRDLSSSKLQLMEAWNSGCAGRQFIRTN